MDAPHRAACGPHLGESRGPGPRLVPGAPHPESPLALAVAAFQAAITAVGPEKPHQQSPLTLKTPRLVRDWSEDFEGSPMAPREMDPYMQKKSPLKESRSRSLGVERSSVQYSKSASHSSTVPPSRQAIQHETRGAGPLERAEVPSMDLCVPRATATPRYGREQSAQDVGGIGEGHRAPSWAWESDECDEAEPNPEAWGGRAPPAPQPRAYSVGVSIKLEAEAMLMRAEMTIPGILSNDTDDDVICKALISRRPSLASPWQRRLMPSRHGMWTRSLDAAASLSPHWPAVHSRSATVGQPQREALFFASQHAMSPASCFEQEFKGGSAREEHESPPPRWAREKGLGAAQHGGAGTGEAQKLLQEARAALDTEPSGSDPGDDGSACWQDDESFEDSYEGMRDCAREALLALLLSELQAETDPDCVAPGPPGHPLPRGDINPAITPGDATDVLPDAAFPLASTTKGRRTAGPAGVLEGPSVLTSASGAKSGASSAASHSARLQRPRSMGGGARRIGRGEARPWSARRERALSSSGLSFWHEEAQVYYGPCQAGGPRASLDDSDVEDRSPRTAPSARRAPNKHVDRLKRSFCMRRPVGPSSDSGISRRQLSNLMCAFSTVPSHCGSRIAPSGLRRTIGTPPAAGPDGEAPISAQPDSRECSDATSDSGTKRSHVQRGEEGAGPRGMTWHGANHFGPPGTGSAQSNPDAGDLRPVQPRDDAPRLRLSHNGNAVRPGQDPITSCHVMPRLHSHPAASPGPCPPPSGLCNASRAQPKGERAGGHHLLPSMSHDSSRYLRGHATDRAGSPSLGVLAACRLRVKPLLRLEIPDYSD